MFHRDAGYLEGRRARESAGQPRRWRTGARSADRPSPGQWASAEFAALARLYAAGAPVPYPAQVLGTELLLEFIGSADGTAAPRLAQLRPDAGRAGRAVRTSWWRRWCSMARDGLAHGDLSAYNLLVWDGRVVMIDLPQVVDVVANPREPGS